MAFPDHFSPLAAVYARHRPTYPEALFDWLAAVAPARRRAWDVATGNGQAAVPLAQRFLEVVASDGSLDQLASARRGPGVRYVAATSEASPLAAGSVDCVTVGQALHWFDLHRFYSEVRRVLRPRGVLVAWTYDVLQVTPQVDAALEWFNRELVARCWPPERRHVETGYRDLPFPFARLEAPPLEMSARWSTTDLLGYLSSWSAVGRYRAVMGEDPIELLRGRLEAAWGVEPRREVRWPLTVVAGRAD